MPKRFENKKAFTLVELLTVVIIISILAGVATPVYRKYITRSRASETVNLLTALRTKQLQNYAKNYTFFKSFKNMIGSLTVASVEKWDASNPTVLTVGGEYKIELRVDRDCAIAYYQPKNNDSKPFVFSISYLKHGLGCEGEVCKRFGYAVTGNVESVCQ